jgi:hypothetical protein
MTHTASQSTPPFPADTETITTSVSGRMTLGKLHFDAARFLGIFTSKARLRYQDPIHIRGTYNIAHTGDSTFDAVFKTTICGYLDTAFYSDKRTLLYFFDLQEFNGTACDEGSLEILWTDDRGSRETHVIFALRLPGVTLKVSYGEDIFKKEGMAERPGDVQPLTHLCLDVM